jgi:hypothetical protein
MSRDVSPDYAYCPLGALHCSDVSTDYADYLARPQPGIVRCRRAADFQGSSESRFASHNCDVHCTLETGARWSSLAEFLKWKHVNFKAEEVTNTTYKDKNMKQWEISVGTRLKTELLKLKLQRTSDDLDERCSQARA